MKKRILKKKFLTVYNHLYYEFSFIDMVSYPTGRLSAFLINRDHYEELKLSNALKHMLEEQPEYVKGYGFTNSEGNMVGHMFVMTKGGNEILYKVRKIDTYFFAIRVFEEYRGRGYAGEIITMIAQNLYKNGKDKGYLVVKKDNYAAIKVYNKLGGRVIGKKNFLRIWKWNVPYLTL